MIDELATVRDYDQLLDALRRRVVELDTTFETVDAVAFDGALGKPMKYTQKLLGGVPVKGIGRLSLGPLLGALGLKLIVAEDHETLQKITKRLTKRKCARWHAGKTMLATRPRRKRALGAFRDNPEMARILRQRQILNQSQEERTRIARRAANARWRRHRRNGKSA